LVYTLFIACRYYSLEFFTRFLSLSVIFKLQNSKFVFPIYRPVKIGSFNVPTCYNVGETWLRWHTFFLTTFLLAKLASTEVINLYVVIITIYFVSILVITITQNMHPRAVNYFFKFYLIHTSMLPRLYTLR
jgi:hypothetical protein